MSRRNRATSPQLRAVSLLVTDLDNTLYDWVDIWYRSFRALLDGLVAISGLDEALLVQEIRTVHQLRGTSEYALLVQELPALRAKHGPSANLAAVYDDAIHAFRSARVTSMSLYPGVIEVLRDLKERGTCIAAYTESQAFYTRDRIMRLGLDGLIDVLFSPADHDFPIGVTKSDLRTRPDDAYELTFTEHRHTPPGVVKPEPTVLRTIVTELGAADNAVYVGDSLMKDVAMAQSLGVADVWAEYGAAQSREEYQLLRAVSHWTDDEIEREKAVSARLEIEPTFVLHESFRELLDLFEFIGA